MQSASDLKGKIQLLEAERLRLRDELDALKKAAEIRAATLEADVAAMREELKQLHEALGGTPQGPSAYVAPAKQVPQYSPTPPAAPVTTVSSQVNTATVLDPPQSVNVSPESMTHEVAQEATSIHDSIMTKLNEDELKIVKILQAHDGKYPQKNVRTEAKLSWLQTNRSISHLMETKVVSFEKEGATEYVVLTKELRK